MILNTILSKVGATNYVLKIESEVRKHIISLFNPPIIKSKRNYGMRPMLNTQQVWQNR